MRKLLVSVALVALSSAAAIAGDVEDAKPMLEKAAVAIKADREVALAQFNRGQFNRGSLDISKDFYPFCIRLTDGKLIARSAFPKFESYQAALSSLKDQV